MPRAKNKHKICKCCKKDFIQYTSFQVACSIPCAQTLARAKTTKKQKGELREIRERLKTHSQYLNELQKEFNTYIRYRDKNKICISCNTPLIGKYDAGHYYSVGAYPALRFNIDNVHGQCVECNQHRHGNLLEYTERLPIRIGQLKFDLLKSIKHESNKLTIAEILELKSKYKKLTIKNNN
jgi:hypothetical protein